MFKKGIAMIFILFILVGCTEKEDVTNTEESDDTGNEEVQDEKEMEKGTDIPDDKLKTIALIGTREEMKAQQGGILVKDISIEEEVEDIFELQEATLNQALRTISNEPEDIDALYKEIVYLLGSPHYKTLIEKAESFEPNFVAPYLPIPGESEESHSNQEGGKAIILLDASSSMLLTVDNQVKMDIASKAAKRFAETIGQSNDLSLIVYGHQGSESVADKALSCEGIEEIYPMGTYDEEAFSQTLASFDSKGYTPLAGAIKKANELSSEFTQAVTIYIISDGVETCDGDPVDEAESFVHSDDNRAVNIIGFDVDEDAENQLKQVSDAGKGKYFSAENAEELKKAIENNWLPSNIDLAWAHQMAPDPWEILEEYDRFDIDLNRIRTVIQIEKDRYDLALRKLREEDLIERETASRISDLISEEYRIKLDLTSDLRSMKLEEIDKEAEEIRDKVDTWVEEMREKKQEQGDLF